MFIREKYILLMKKWRESRRKRKGQKSRDFEEKEGEREGVLEREREKAEVGRARLDFLEETEHNNQDPLQS